MRPAEIGRRIYHRDLNVIQRGDGLTEGKMDTIASLISFPAYSWLVSLLHS